MNNKGPKQGRPLKDPAAGKRKMVSLKLSPNTVNHLKKSRHWGISQSELVDQAVEHWINS
jgi:hypothetical protein